MIIFYSPDIAACPELSEEDSGHAVRVLRHQEGDEITVVDGCGSFYNCVIAAAHPKHCALQVKSVEAEQHWAYGVHLAVAPTKNLDRIEWFVEKATEMGLDRFTPLKCRFSERKELKTERIRKIAVSAMKQSLKATVPQIDEMTDIKTFICEPFDGQKFIAHCMKDEPRKLLSHEIKAGAAVRVLIGPEGDFSQEEVALAIEHGYVPVSLGEQRLRTETAALASVHTIHVVNELKLTE
ncbi:MAG: 16S rRNA (uracil(1498)-N(3))-methyltransferase [Bacteroidales bacterium]|nr:16S rRNA (uracil(1498)-N(3))-methyltransferase [Candidatus Liminaster caballi]